METNKNGLNSRGQVTIFIIIGLLLVAVILAVFYFTGTISFTESPAQNPEAYLQNCMTTSVKEAEKIILDSNGYPGFNSDNYILYNKEKVPYLCSTSEFYYACMPQDPAFFARIRTLMENKVSRDTEACLKVLVEDSEKKGYNVKVEPGNISLKIQKDSINVNFGKTIYLAREGDSLQVANFDAVYGTKLYDMLKLEQTIVNYESTACEFDYVAWMRYETSLIISKTRTSDQTKIYTLQDRLTERKIKFAIKTCVLPAGI